MVENDTCVVCGSENLKVVRVRPSLSYYDCQSCRHCDLINTEGNVGKLFEAAQEKYFGEESVLSNSENSSLDDEILSSREDVVGSVLSTPSDVLEVGPGSGAFVAWLLDRGHRVIAVEQSRILANKLSGQLSAGVVLGEFENIDLEKETVDVFCSFHVIEHVRDPLAHLQKALDVVRLDGYAFIATPNAGSWQQRLFPLLSPNFDSAHLRVFSQSSLAQLCEAAGWSIVRVVTPEHTVNWIRVATKLLRRVKGEDEEETAGKYAGRNSGVINMIGWIARVVTFPLRSVQKALGGGNELFFILQKRV